ncbi:MAG TPA: hypothetical protein VGG75_14830 [Trebonia sp.]|jgi:hypothetical protein
MYEVPAAERPVWWNPRTWWARHQHPRAAHELYADDAPAPWAAGPRPAEPDSGPRADISIEEMGDMLDTALAFQVSEMNRQAREAHEAKESQAEAAAERNAEAEADEAPPGDWWSYGYGYTAPEAAAGDRAAEPPPVIQGELVSDEPQPAPDAAPTAAGDAEAENNPGTAPITPGADEREAELEAHLARQEAEWKLISQGIYSSQAAADDADAAEAELAAEADWRDGRLGPQADPTPDAAADAEAAEPDAAESGGGLSPAGPWGGPVASAADAVLEDIDDVLAAQPAPAQEADADVPAADPGPVMGADYYTAAAGSDAHRGAYAEYHAATDGIGAAYPDDVDLSYEADNYEELKIERWYDEQAAEAERRADAADRDLDQAAEAEASIDEEPF